MSSSLEPTPNILVPHTTVGSVCDSSRGCIRPCLNEGEAGIEDENETVTVTPASCLSSCLLPRHEKKKKKGSRERHADRGGDRAKGVADEGGGGRGRLQELRLGRRRRATVRQQGQHRPSLTLTMTLIPDSQSVDDAEIFGSERMYVYTNELLKIPVGRCVVHSKQLQ